MGMNRSRILCYKALAHNDWEVCQFWAFKLKVEGHSLRSTIVEQGALVDNVKRDLLTILDFETRNRCICLFSLFLNSMNHVPLVTLVKNYFWFITQYMVPVMNPMECGCRPFQVAQ